jgi:hypothetical protein
MILASETYGMGDILLLTSIAKHFPESCEVHLQPQAARFSRFFRNICSKIVITNDIKATPDIGPGHYALKKLRGLGYETLCYMPYVHYSKEELDEGLEWIKPYKNPIVFVANVSAQWKHEREPEEPYFQNIVDELNKSGHTVLQFGISNNFTLLKNTIPMIDLDIDTLIKYYAAINRFVGVDTGDTHLMLAVGGSCDIFIPLNSSRLPELWNYDSHRAVYHYF